MGWAEANLPTKCHFDPSSRLATKDMGRGLYGRRLSQAKHAPVNIESVGLVCLFSWGAGSPSNTT